MTVWKGMGTAGISWRNSWFHWEWKNRFTWPWKPGPSTTRTRRGVWRTRSASGARAGGIFIWRLRQRGIFFTCRKRALSRRIFRTGFWTCRSLCFRSACTTGVILEWWPYGPCGRRSGFRWRLPWRRRSRTGAGGRSAGSLGSFWSFG